LLVIRLCLERGERKPESQNPKVYVVLLVNKYAISSGRMTNGKESRESTLKIILDLESEKLIKNP